MEILVKVFKQTGWQLAGKVISSLSTILILALMTRYYGLDGTGVFTLSTTVLFFLYLISDFSINAYLLPHLLDHDSEKFWNKALGLRIIMSAVLIVLAAVIVFFWPIRQDFKELTYLGLITVFGYAIYTNANAIFQAKHRYDLSIIASSASSIISAILTVGVIMLSLPLPYVILTQVIGWSFCAALSLTFAKKFIAIKPIFDRFFIKNTLHSVWPISLTLLLNLLYFRADSFILSFYHSFTEVGLYNVAYSVFQNALVVPTFIMNAYYPIMLRNLNQDKLIFLKQIKIASIGLLGLSILGALVTLILSPIIIQILGSTQGSVASLNILALGFPAFFLSSILMWMMISLKKYQQIAIVYAGGLVLNIILNLLFIPEYSYIGASWVTVASEYFILVVLFLLLIPEFKSKK